MKQQKISGGETALELHDCLCLIIIIFFPRKQDEPAYAFHTFLWSEQSNQYYSVCRTRVKFFLNDFSFLLALQFIVFSESK